MDIEVLVQRRRAVRKRQNRQNSKIIDLKDPCTWEDILKNYGPGAIRTCKTLLKKVGEPPAIDAEDCLEEAVLRLYERRDAIMFSHSGQIGKWLIVTSRNYCMDQIKHLFGPSNRKPSSIQAAWLLGMDSTSPIFVGHLDLGKFLRKLSLDDRNILFAKYYLGMTSKEIGERNNLDPSHIRTKISRLLGAAKQELKNTSKSDKKTKKKSINLKAKGGITDE